MTLKPKLGFVFLIVSLLMSVGVCSQDMAPAKVRPVSAMEHVSIPAHLNPGLSVDLENPASYLYPEWSNVYVHKFEEVELPDSVVISMKGYVMPTDSTRITDTYGYRQNRGRLHLGIDVKVLTGDTIRAAFDGKVRISRYERRGYGHYLVMREILSDWAVIPGVPRARICILRPGYWAMPSTPPNCLIFRIRRRRRITLSIRRIPRRCITRSRRVIL